MIWPDLAERQKFFRFIIVGITNTAVMYLFYLLLLYLGTQYLLALTVDYGLGVCFSYLMNRNWTFSEQGQSPGTFIKYSASYVVAYILNFSLLFASVAGLGLDERMAQIPALGLATIANYCIQRFWVFRPT